MRQSSFKFVKKFDFIIEWHINLYSLFNDKPILLEEQ